MKKYPYLSLCLIVLLIFSSFGGYLPSTKAQADSLLESPLISADKSVQFSYDNATAKEVKVAGSFSDWQNGALSMEKDENNRWSLTVPNLEAGVYQYKFIVDNEWITDPANKELADGNSKLIVPGLNLDLLPVKVEKNTSYPLEANLVKKDGSIQKISQLTWSLKEIVEGIELINGQLIVHENVKANDSFILVAEKDGEKVEKKIEIVGDMYTYTINYYRLDENYEKWDLWIYNSGLQDGGFSFTKEENDPFKFISGEFSFPEKDITIIPRKGNWETQDTENTIAIAEGKQMAEAWIIEGLDTVFYSKEEAIKAIEDLKGNHYERRHIQFMYDRMDQNYTDWNVWVWGTGVKDDQIDFDQNLHGMATATINVSEVTQSVGFILRKGENWDTAIKEGNGDRYIPLNKTDLITKVYATSGQDDLYIVPEVTGPVLTDGNATFYYRDKELYTKNEMEKIEKVELQFNGKRYKMTNETKNERYSYTLENIPEGNHPYSFIVTMNGVETEVTDPYNTIDGLSTLAYEKPDMTIHASIQPKEVTYNENAVLSVDYNQNKNSDIREVYADLRAIGGKEKVGINPQLNELTIAIDQATTTGVKDIPVTIIDEYGNIHTVKAELTVKARQSVGKDDFDWDEARIYFMLTDRFFDGDSSNNDPYNIGYDSSKPGTYHGGDFKGITQRLDYLENLGINTIWINPIVENIQYDVRYDNPDTPYYAYHGYWASNFEKLNPHFGTMEDFHELIDAAHERGIKIMVDVVVNHAGYGLKTNDAINDGKIANFPTQEDRNRFAGMFRDGGTDTVQGELSGLPDLLTENEEVRKQIINWQTSWIEKSKTAKGNTIDYFRVDTVKHVENTTWMSFKNELTKIMPSFKLIGEAWGAQVNDDQGYLNSGMMDSLLDFDFKYLARDFANGDIIRVQNALEERNNKLSNTGTLGQFLGSHDEDGFLESVGGDVGKLKLAAALQITAKGQPVIYYGEELGLSGANNYPYYDNRYSIDWNVTENNEILAHYTKLLNTRKEYSDVFSKGTRSQISGSDVEGYSVFKREYSNQQVFVGLNTKETATEVTFKIPFAEEAVDLYSGKTYPITDSQITVILPSRDDGGTILLVDAKKARPTQPAIPETPETSEEIDTETPPVSDGKNTETPVLEDSKQSDSQLVSEPTEKQNIGKGESLPNTATASYNLVLIGLGLLLIGAIIVLVQRKKRASN
ncbi:MULTISPECIES: alpha-amylase family glycosyl hydrolase [Bacillaceae]|uniref:alpha-amylase family glycosyl hydrolase n=1 Tax=Bacillaceae TaxID=186817 RepID=UPI001F3EEDED|nr:MULTISPECIES: alpha-amylase family glycosyl hydrolase [Bacillaceae]MCF2647745.1 LPXTG cell wall anchor domain-containing protein [Niallia circulans]